MFVLHLLSTILGNSNLLTLSLYELVLWYCKYAVGSILLQSSPEAALFLVRITTIPSHGPFKLQQTVQFFCNVEPTRSTLVTYRWRSVEHLYGQSSYSGDSFNKTFYGYNLRYCWFSCIVTLNQTILGSADKLIEIHGKSIKGSCMADV